MTNLYRLDDKQIGQLQQRLMADESICRQVDQVIADYLCDLPFAQEIEGRWICNPEWFIKLDREVHYADED